MYLLPYLALTLPFLIILKMRVLSQIYLLFNVAAITAFIAGILFSTCAQTKLLLLLKTSSVTSRSSNPNFSQTSRPTLLCLSWYAGKLCIKTQLLAAAFITSALTLYGASASMRVCHLFGFSKSKSQASV